MPISIETLGPFDVRPEDLMQIAPAEAVDLFRQLLVIEASRIGIPVSGVDVPSAINVADGGIDAEVAGVSGATLPAGLIHEGSTCYQVKTGSFSASTRSDIRSLLVQQRFVAGDHQRTKEQLQPRVLSCFERRAIFAVVLFGSELVGTEDDHGAAQIRAFMADIDPAFAHVTVRVIRVNQLCSAIKMLAPGIALRLNRMQRGDLAVFQNISFMAEACDLEIDSYRPTPQLERITEQITQAVNEIEGFQHVRVLGDAGAGKTHLVYRALCASNFGGCVLYCRDPEQALLSVSMTALHQMSDQTTIILVADECDFDTAEELKVRFKRRARKMLLVTADNVSEASTAHSDTRVIEVPQLEQPVVSEIFQGYRIPESDANWLASLCEGSPRAAHKLGQYIQAHPDQQPAEHLSHLDRLWDRIVCTPHNVQSAEGRDRLAVIRTLALFRQVAWETLDGPTVQSSVLATLQHLDQSFSPLKLSHSVRALRDRRILQGPRTLLISPKLLHVAMWKSWFENYAAGVDVLQLREGLEARMQQHFDAMLVYARESGAAAAWANRLLGEGGIFASLAGYSSASDARLFFAVAQANPKAALRRFAVALGLETIEARKEFSGEARRIAIHSLEQLAVPSDTFLDAAQCLLLLAEAENESWSNNSTGIFISLFSLGQGEVAASELSPVLKLDYLRSLLRSDRPFFRSIAVQAIGASLDPFMSRDVIEEVIGLRRLPSRWMPATYAELYEAYAAHVRLLDEALDFLPGAEANQAAQGVLDHFRSLILVIPILEPVLAFMHHAVARAELREPCIEALVATIHHEGEQLTEATLAELRSMLAELTESSFSQRLRRHAGMKLISDSFDSVGEYSDAAGPELLQLAFSAVEEATLLIPELAWLVTGEAKNGFQFGELLGQADSQRRLWNSIVSAWIQAGEQRSDFFIGGYLRAVHGADMPLWEQLVEALFSNPEVRQSAVNVVWRSGMSAHIANLMLEVAQQGGIDAKSFRIFVYGGAVNQLPLSVVEGIVDRLLEVDDPNAPSAAIELVDARLRGNLEMNVLSPRVVRALSSPVFIEGDVRCESSVMLQHFWNDLANRLLEFDSDSGAALAVRCIENFGNEGSVTAGYLPDALKFITNAARAKPATVWPAIAHCLERPRESRTWRLLNWLRGGRPSRASEASGLAAIPLSMIFEWIDVSPAERAWLLAERCPPTVSRPEEPSSIARQLLERYGAIEQVRQSLHANSFTESWGGPASAHYRRKLVSLEAHFEMETNTNVRTWLQEQRQQLELRIQREEERELREREY